MFTAYDEARSHDHATAVVGGNHPCEPEYMGILDSRSCRPASMRRRGGESDFGLFVAGRSPSCGVFNWGERIAGLGGLCHDVCGDSHMATNLSIDPELIERALVLSGERTKKAAVTKALQEFIARRRQKRLLDLVGKLEWDSSYDYKAQRTRK